MKLLIGIKSCNYDRDRGAHQIVRDTWAQDIEGADLIFFTGREGTKAHHTRAADSDEVFVDAGDEYPDLPYKTREIVRYALANEYDYVFLCDTGSFVIPHHLMAYGFENYDYMGYWGLAPEPFPFTAADRARGCRPVYIEKCYPWASGGGYVLSRRAMEFVARGEPTVWAEDLWTAQILAKNGIFLTDKSRDGWKGFVCDWIHLEKSDPVSLERRRKWMTEKREQVNTRCATEGCASLSWNRNQPRRDQPQDDPEEVERIIQQRRESRKK